MSLGAKLEERWRARRVRVVVPEWKGIVEDDSQGEPAVYAAPFTLEDQRALTHFFTDEMKAEGMAEVVLRKAEHEDGRRMFSRGDKATLMGQVEAYVLAELAAQIMNPVDLEAAQGNSDGTTDSPPSSPWVPDSARH